MEVSPQRWCAGSVCNALQSLSVCREELRRTSGAHDARCSDSDGMLPELCLEELVG